MYCPVPPPQKGGLQIGDEIIAVGNLQVAGAKIEQIIQVMTHLVNNAVVLTVRRKGGGCSADTESRPFHSARPAGLALNPHAEGLGMPAKQMSGINKQPATKSRPRVSD